MTQGFTTLRQKLEKKRKLDFMIKNSAIISECFFKSYRGNEVKYIFDDLLHYSYKLLEKKESKEYIRKEYFKLIGKFNEFRNKNTPYFYANTQYEEYFYNSKSSLLERRLHDLINHLKLIKR